MAVPERNVDRWNLFSEKRFDRLLSSFILMKVSVARVGSMSFYTVVQTN